MEQDTDEMVFNKHQCLPFSYEWEDGEHLIYCDNGNVVAEVHGVLYEQRKANAEFIVLACNNFEDMADTLVKIANGEYTAKGAAMIARSTLQDAGIIGGKAR